VTGSIPVLIGVGVVTLAIGAQAAQQQPVFRSGVDGVSVTVSVRKGNAAITGLTSKDFELRDNGVVQTISTFAVEALPIDVTLLLHVSRSIAGYRLEWLRSSVQETAGLLKRDDRLRLVAVQHALREIVPFQPGVAPIDTRTLTATGGTALYDALAAAMMRRSEPDRRQLIVAFTTGVDTISILSREAAEAVAGLADTVVHVVVPVGGTSSVRRSAIADAAPLGTLVARTGGQIFPADIDQPIAGAFTRALDEFRTSYVLRYIPAGVAKGGWHDISVTVKGGPYEVRARKGYGH
jgi:VWFA-related protein